LLSLTASTAEFRQTFEFEGPTRQLRIDRSGAEDVAEAFANAISAIVNRASLDSTVPGEIDIRLGARVTAVLEAAERSLGDGQRAMVSLLYS
jgi:hypothetical protein